MAKSIEMKDKILENAVKITREEITDLFPKDCVKGLACAISTSYETLD